MLKASIRNGRCFYYKGLYFVKSRFTAKIRNRTEIRVRNHFRQGKISSFLSLIEDRKKEIMCYTNNE